jgi:hypothetical protein
MDALYDLRPRGSPLTLPLCHLHEPGCPPPDFRQVVFRAEEDRAKPKAGRTGREPFSDIARTDAAYWKYFDIVWQHGAQSLQVLWAVGRCGKQLKLLRAGANRVKRFDWRCYAGQHLQAELQATSDHGMTAMLPPACFVRRYIIRRQPGSDLMFLSHPATISGVPARAH